MLFGEQQQSLLSNYHEATSKMDPEAIATCFRHNAKIRLAGDDMDILGRENIITFFTNVFSLSQYFQRIHLRHFMDKNKVLLIGKVKIISQKHPTKQTIFEVPELFQFDDSGLISELVIFFDRENFLDIYDNDSTYECNKS